MLLPTPNKKIQKSTETGEQAGRLAEKKALLLSEWIIHLF